MKKLTIYQQIYKTLLSILTIWIFFLWYNIAENIINTEILITWIDDVSEDIPDSKKFENMVNNFCDAVWTAEGYDSSQSIFVYYVCKKAETKPDFNTNKWFSENKTTSYINFITDNEWNNINSLDNYLPSLYYDTEKYIQILFDTIIGSYTSIYQANIYGYANNPDKTTEELIHENFAKKHFKIDKKEYIEICSTEKEEYKYPKTCKKLKEYFYWAKNLINSNTENYLNDQNIYKNLPKDKLWDTCFMDKKQNIISCGIYWWNISYFTNMVYNELMFYALFVEYYWYLLQNKSDFKNRDITEFQKKLAKNQNRIQTMVNNLNSSREAINTTIKMLKELQYSFPIHIGFLMYTENIYRFTSSMNKTLTPIYTLHDILRNVQKTD